jgi:hypothetical protein
MKKWNLKEAEAPQPPKEGPIDAEAKAMASLIMRDIDPAIDQWLDQLQNQIRKHRSTSTDWLSNLKQLWGAIGGNPVQYAPTGGYRTSKYSQQPKKEAYLPLKLCNEVQEIQENLFGNLKKAWDEAKPYDLSKMGNPQNNLILYKIMRNAKRSLVKVIYTHLVDSIKKMRGEFQELEPKQKTPPKSKEPYKEPGVDPQDWKDIFGAGEPFESVEKRLDDLII